MTAEDYVKLRNLLREIISKIRSAKTVDQEKIENTESEEVH